MHTTGNLVADTICRTAEIGLTITDAADAGPLTVINATPVAVDDRCPDCGNCGTRRDHVTRRLVDLPVVGFPTRLHVRVPRLTCGNEACGRKIFQASLACADNGAKLTRRVTRWILQRLAVDRMSVSATAKALGVGWELVNRVAVEAVRNLVYADPNHLAGVRILGVDEHVWKHTRRPGEPSSFVTVLVDLTPLADGHGPARLIDMCPGRSAEVLRSWLDERDPGFRHAVQVVTMDGFAGFCHRRGPDTSCGEEGDGSVPCRAPGRREAHRLSATPAARNHRATGQEERSAVQAPENAADEDKFSDRSAEATTGRAVGGRR